jgi:hypothetical protein
MSASPPDGEPLTYICPKPVFNSEDDYHIVIEPNDINIIYPHEIVVDSLVWTSLMWGGRRDLSLVRRLSKHQNLADTITILINFVWKGYDLLVAEILSQINCNETEEQLERSITQSLVLLLWLEIFLLCVLSIN